MYAKCKPFLPKEWVEKHCFTNQRIISIRPPTRRQASSFVLKATTTSSFFSSDNRKTCIRVTSAAIISGVVKNVCIGGIAPTAGNPHDRDAHCLWRRDGLSLIERCSSFSPFKKGAYERGDRFFQPRRKKSGVKRVKISINDKCKNVSRRLNHTRDVSIASCGRV